MFMQLFKNDFEWLRFLKTINYVDSHREFKENYFCIYVEKKQSNEFKTLNIYKQNQIPQ